jgi:hypothetical protein
MTPAPPGSCSTPTSVNADAITRGPMVTIAWGSPIQNSGCTCASLSECCLS